MPHITDEEFESAVGAALDGIPDRLLGAFDNVIVTVADEPDEEQLGLLGAPGAERCGDELLGLYDGIPLTERGVLYGEGDLPDVITIFKGPHERCFPDRRTVLDEVRKTVVHEVGHFFGNDEHMLEEMGY